MTTRYDTKLDEQDYENLRCQDHQNQQQVPPPLVRRSSLDATEHNGVSVQHQLPIPESHTISISPDSEDSGSPREGNPNAAKTSNNSNNGRLQPGTLSPIQDDVPWYQSTPSVMSQGYSSPTSPLTPTLLMNGETFPPNDPTASHKSLQLSFSNPVTARGAPRSQSSMSQSSTLAHPSGSLGPRSMGQAARGFSRSSNSMGRSVGQSSRQVSRSSGKVHSIPADMNHFTDV